MSTDEIDPDYEFARVGALPAAKKEKNSVVEGCFV